MTESMLTVQQVADMLGVSIYHIYRLKDKPGGIPAYKIGRCVRFKPSEVEAYISSQAVKPAEKPEPFVKTRFHYVPGMRVV